MKNLKSLLLPAAFALLAVCSTQAQTIIGAWSFGNTATSDSGVLVFFSNGTYFHVEDTIDGSGYDGYERGTWSWDGINGHSFTVSGISDYNGGIGLSTLNAAATLSISGNSFVFGNPDGLGGTGDTLSRVTGGNALVSAWYDGDVTSALSSDVVIFMPNNTYYHISDRGVNPGMERGTYTWNSGTLAFSNTVLFETNGSAGISGNFEASVSGNILTHTDSFGPSMLTSVSAIPEPSTYAALAGLGALGLALWRRRKAHAAA